MCSRIVVLIIYTIDSVIDDFIINTSQYLYYDDYFRSKTKPINSRRSDIKKGQTSARASSSTTARRSEVAKSVSSRNNKKEDRPSSSKSERLVSTFHNKIKWKLVA